MADNSRSGAAEQPDGSGQGRRSGRGAATGVVSACALLFSAVSLYETVLRQPELSVHVAPVIHYTRDEGQEAIAVPITIANRGAREGTIHSLTLSANGAGRATPKTFYSAYVVGSGYFLRSRLEKSATGGLQITKERPKVPFAPLNVQGRGNYSGTILFLPKGKDFPRLITEPGQFTLTLTPNVPLQAAQGWADRLLAPRTTTVTFKVKLADFNQRVVERGDTIELKDATW